MENETNVIQFAENKKRIFDQTASMHFYLSDRYKRFSTIGNAIEIAISILICGLTFLDFETYFGLPSQLSSLVMGFSAIFLLIFTLVKQSLNHKQLCEQHHLAGKVYVQAKSNLASRLVKWKSQYPGDDEVIRCLNAQCEALDDLPQIPERWFLKLKHAHQNKVEFSKYLDNHLREPWIICRLKFLFFAKSELKQDKQ